MMNIAYFFMTDKGAEVVNRLNQAFPGRIFDKSNYKEAVKELWESCDAFVFVMASGIAVRTIAPYVRSKMTDPAVVVMDQEGRFAISLLSGHVGGANELAKKLARVTGGQAVITTATDVENVPAMDVFAKENHLKIENIHQLKYISSAMVERKPVLMISQWRIYGRFPENVRLIQEVGDIKNLNLDKKDMQGRTAVVIGMPSFCKKAEAKCKAEHVLRLSKRPYVVGTGCKREMDEEYYGQAFHVFLGRLGIEYEDVGALATIDLKKDEVCINKLARILNADILIYTNDEIEKVDVANASGKRIETSEFVRRVTGVGSVSEVCAWLGSGKGRIIAGKTKFHGITFALAVREEALRL